MSKAALLASRAASKGLPVAPPPGDSLPSGTLVASDPCTVDNVVNVWHNATDSFYLTTTPANFVAAIDKQNTRHTDDGNYRRLKLSETATVGSHALPVSTITVVSTADFPASGQGPAASPDQGILWVDGQEVTYSSKDATHFFGCAGGTGTITTGSPVRMQSIYDAGASDIDYRTQMGNFSNTGNNFHTYVQGEHSITRMEVRCQFPTPLPYTIAAAPGGNTGTCQTVQWKTTTGAGWDPILQIMEGLDGFKLVWDDNVGHTEWKTELLPPTPKGVWHGLALEAIWHSDPAQASFTIWANWDGAGWEQRIGPITGKKTLYAQASPKGALSLGCYSKLSLPAVYRDYRDIRIEAL
jgi:hypothetical protein